MISALAFGYGVGMTTPDSTLASARAAVAAYQGSQRAGPAARPGAAAPAHAWAGQGPTAGPEEPFPYGQAGPFGPWGYGPAGYPAYGAPRYAAPPQRGDGPGRESRELGRLRQVVAGASCPLQRPVQSDPPPYASGTDGVLDDVDDLDPAGQEALSRLQLPDFEVPVTRRAIAYLRFLTRSERGRDLYETWLKRSGRYQDMIQQELRERGLPEDLIWVAMIESGFDPRAVSPAGAVGLWQFMRSTGEIYGLQVDRYLDMRRDPASATRAAAHHLRDLHQRFGSWDLALAAYNMGYEQLLAAIDQYATTDFGELARQRAIPTETANYVPKIVAAALVANNLERYGYGDVRLHAPLHAAELAVPPGMSLQTVAKAAGVSGATIRQLNPQLIQDRVPAGGSTWVVNVPSESLSRARAALPALVDSRVAATDADVLDPMGLLVGGGKGTARRTWDEDENLLGRLPAPKRRSLREMLGEGRRGDRDEALAALADDFAPRRSERETLMYRVGPGDTLLGVARQFAVDVEDLARDNGIEPDARLREGALLRLSVRRDVVERFGRKAQPPAEGAPPPDGGAEQGGGAAPPDGPAKDKPKQSEKASPGKRSGRRQPA
ncbi:MAG: transglycosylase SLT domain-containing protein [Deltaproteobacteria bacterium]|nr:transglycosylase SLT domain-containing protein [Deltaproteobacteria bacterium]